MAWTLYKEVKYAADGIPGENLDDFPKLVSITADADIAAELSGGGGIKFTSADGLTDLPFGLYPTSNLSAGTILARVKLDLLTAASVGDVMCRLYYSSTESTDEDKAGTVSDGYYLFIPYEEDPSGSAPQIFDWVSETNLGTSAGTMTSGDLVAGVVGNAIDFDGSNDRIRFSSLSTPTGAITIEVIANYDDSLGAGGKHAVDFGVSTTARIALRCTNNDWFIRSSSSQTINGVVAGVVADEFRSYALIINGTTAEAYSNGSSTGPGGSNGSYTLEAHATVDTPPLGGAIFGGQIDEMRVSSVARSANWLAYAHTDDFENGDTFTLGTEQGGSATFTATATLTVGGATLAGSAEFDPPVYDGTAALVVGAAVLAGSATFDAPVYTGTAPLTAGAATLAGSAQFNTVVFSASASFTTGGATLAGSAEFDSPVYTASADLDIGGAEFAGSGEFDPPVYTATGDLDVGPATLAASGTFAADLNTGSAALTIGAVTLVASGAFAAAVPESSVCIHGAEHRYPALAGSDLRYPALAGGEPPCP